MSGIAIAVLDQDRSKMDASPSINIAVRTRKTASPSRHRMVNRQDVEPGIRTHHILDGTTSGDEGFETKSGPVGQARPFAPP